MSDTEVLVGWIEPVEMLSSIEETAKKICMDNGWDKCEFFETFVEVLEDDGYKKYIILNDRIYKVFMQNDDPYEDIFQANKMDDGSYDFTLRYYNGGCSFGEALEQAIKNIEG